MTDDRARQFADALSRLETDQDVDRFVEDLFTPDAELLRPETERRTTGTTGAREFWSEYLRQFDEIRSQFTRVIDSGQIGLLEWTSTGRIRGGADITYRGVSLLDFQDGRVRRFATYYDTQPFSPLARR